jgi:hypothetical protein
MVATMTAEIVFTLVTLTKELRSQSSEYAFLRNSGCDTHAAIS